MGEKSGFEKIFLIIFAIAFLFPVITAIRTFFPNITLNPIAVVLIVLGIIVVWVISTYNKLVSLSQRVKQAQGGIDVYLKQRFDLIPNLVETVKGYAAYEKGLMENIAKLRNDYAHQTEKEIGDSHTATRCKYIREETQRHLKNLSSEQIIQTDMQV